MDSLTTESSINSKSSALAYPDTLLLVPPSAIFTSLVVTSLSVALITADESLPSVKVSPETSVKLISGLTSLSIIVVDIELARVDATPLTTESIVSVKVSCGSSNTSSSSAYRYTVLVTLPDGITSWYPDSVSPCCNTLLSYNALISSSPRAPS